MSYFNFEFSKCIINESSPYKNESLCTQCKDHYAMTLIKNIPIVNSLIQVEMDVVIVNIKKLIQDLNTWIVLMNMIILILIIYFNVWGIMVIIIFRYIYLVVYKHTYECLKCKDEYKR